MVFCTNCTFVSYLVELNKYIFEVKKMFMTLNLKGKLVPIHNLDDGKNRRLTEFGFTNPLPITIRKI